MSGKKKNPLGISATVALQSETAPRGWVEVRAESTTRVYDSDIDAARAVARAGGQPGCAMLWSSIHGLFVPIEERDQESHFDGSTRASRTWRWLCPIVEAMGSGGWICIVPARCAFDLGLITVAELMTCLEATR